MTIQAAIADRRISSADRDAVEAACGSSTSGYCLATIQAALADRRVTQAEGQVLRDACETM